MLETEKQSYEEKSSSDEFLTDKEIEDGTKSVKDYFLEISDMLDTPALRKISDNVLNGDFFKKIKFGKDKEMSPYDLITEDAKEYMELEQNFLKQGKGAQAEQYREEREKAEKISDFLFKLGVKTMGDSFEKSSFGAETGPKKKSEILSENPKPKRWKLNMEDKKGWQEVSQESQMEEPKSTEKAEAEGKDRTKPEEKRRAPKPVEEKLSKENIDSDAEFLSNPDFEKDIKRTVKAFRNITTNEKGEHRHLAKERNEMVALNIEARGGRIVRGKEAIEEARQEIAKKEALRVENELHKKAMDTLIARLPEKYKKNEEMLNAYIESIKDKLELVGANRNIAFDNLVNNGYLVENAKKRWFSFEFKIPNIDKEKQKEPFVYNPTLHFESLIKKSILDIKSQAEERADSKIEQGREKMKQERQKCMKEIVAGAVSGYKEKQQEKAQKTKEREQTEYAKNASEKYRGERLKEIKEKQSRGEELSGADKVVLSKLGIKSKSDGSFEADDILKYLQENISEKKQIDIASKRTKPKKIHGKEFNPAENGGRTFQKRRKEGISLKPLLRRNFKKSKKP